MVNIGGFSTSRWVSRLPPFARRALQVDQMEFDSALSQMYSLCTAPSLVTKMSTARKMTKNRYHRDDPAFLVLQLFFMLVVTFSQYCALGSGFGHFVSRFLYNVVVHYLVVGCVFASAEWVFMGRVLAPPGRAAELRDEVDWFYSLDVHFNGYFSYFMWSQAGTYVLLPLCVGETGTLGLVIVNGLFAMGCATYVYNVFLGYLAIPMLTQQQKLTYPIPFIALTYLIATFVTGTNVPKWFLEMSWL